MLTWAQIAIGILHSTAVSPMSGSPTFDTGKKNRNGANLKLRHTLRVGGVKMDGKSCGILLSVSTDMVQYCHSRVLSNTGLSLPTSHISLKLK